MAKGYSTSHVWRKLIAVREEVEYNIQWQVKIENSCFLFDNWTGQGALYYVESGKVEEEELEVMDFVVNGAWNEQKLRSKLSEEMVEYIPLYRTG